MQIQREALLKEFSEFAYSGNGVIVGPPGIGKTYIMKNFAVKLNEQKIPFLYLPVDKLSVETESDLRDEIGINGSIIDFLKSKNNEKSRFTGFLLIDAFDAARSEKTQRIFMNLIHLAVKELNGFWNVIVSVRIYDAKKSEELLDLFPNPDQKLAAEEINCRHFFVPKLTDEEIIEAIETIPYPTNFYENISPDLKELLRTPFNLWVLEKLLSRNQNIPELSSISSEIQLLSLFWKQRVTDGIAGENRQMLLTKITQKMVKDRSLSTNIADFYPVDDIWNSLLSSEILVKVSSTGQRIAFSHNILFDYAVSVLLMEDSPDKFIEFIEEDPSRPLFLRPSLIYYFTRIWYSDPKLFWGSLWYILPNRNIHLRLFTRFLPTGVIANEARNMEQLTPLIDSLEKKEYYSTETVVYILQALRTLEIKRDQLWARFLDKVACDLDKEFAWDLAILTSEILRRTEKKDDDIIFQICGSISRSLLQWVLQERKSSSDKWIDSLGGNWATFLVAETFGTNPQGSKELLEKILGLIKEENFPINYIFRLIDSLTSITHYDPSFTAEIYLTVLAHEEKSKEPTYFGTPVVPLSSTRSQDFEMCHHQLIEHFPNFLETNPLLATETAVKCLNSYVISKHVLPYYKEEQIKEITQKFQFRGKLVYYIPDGSHIWWNDEGPHRYEPTEMAETLFEFIYEKSLSRTNHTELETIFDLLRDNVCVAFFWKLLLKTAIRDAKNFAPFICDLCIAKPIQIESDTTYEFGEFLQVASTEFTEEQLYQIEKSILHIPEGEIENNRRQHLEKYRDRLLTRIPAEFIKTEEGKQILEDIKKTNKIPENKPLVRFESFSKSYSEDDWFEEQGINLSEPSNEEIRTYFPKLNEFISKWQNKEPTKQDIELVFPDIEQLLYILLDETSDAHEEVLTSAWTKLASCTKIISKNIDYSEKIFEICREILLTCSKHLQPDSSSKYNLEFNSPCWSPYPRTEAAEGLARIAAINCDDEILNVIRDLTKDKVPSVRYLIAGQLFRISKNASYEFWKLVEDMVETEDNQLVLQSLCYNFNYLVVKEEDKTINILKKLIKRFSLADQNSSLLEMTVPLIVWLALVREDKWAIETYCEVISDPIKYSESLKRATSDTITFYLTPQKFDSINDSKVAKRAIDYLLETINFVKSEIMKFIYVSEKNETIRSKIKDMLEIIDEIIIRLYFAVDIKDKQHKEEMPSDKQMKTYYENIKPLLEQILIFTSEEKNIMNAMTAHYFMELLNCVLKYDPKGVLKLATKVAKSSQNANYNLDIIAIKETVKLVETILADQKLEIRDEESIKNLVDLLDIFSISGSPEALKLVWQLDKVFR